jgi:hypothetical protein
MGRVERGKRRVEGGGWKEARGKRTVESGAERKAPLVPGQC